MNNNFNIRTEKNADTQRIHYLIESAFKNHPNSNQKEHLLVSALRVNNALSLSLVAEVNDKIVGHIAFSEVTINDQFDFWYGLAPVSVDPNYQNQRVGSRLIRYGLKELKELGAHGCVLVGKPGYYKRFGFGHQDKLSYKGVPDEYFLALSFQKEIPAGNVKYHDLFRKYG